MAVLDTTILPGKAGGMWLVPFSPWVWGAQNPVEISPFFHPALVSRDLMVARARDDLNSGWVRSGLYRHCQCLKPVVFLHSFKKNYFPKDPAIHQGYNYLHN